MTTSEIIKTIMKEKGVKQNALSAAMGHNSPSAIYNILQRNNMDTDNLVKILDLLDYEVVVQPKTQGKRKEGSMVLTSGDEKKSQGE